MPKAKNKPQPLEFSQGCRSEEKEKEEEYVPKRLDFDPGWSADEEAKFQVQCWKDVVALAVGAIGASLSKELVVLILSFVKPTTQQLCELEKLALRQLLTPTSAADPSMAPTSSESPHVANSLHKINWSVAYSPSPEGEAAEKTLSVQYHLLSHLLTKHITQTPKSETKKSGTKSTTDTKSGADGKSGSTDAGKSGTDGKVRERTWEDILLDFSHVLVTVTPNEFREKRDLKAVELETAFPINFHADRTVEPHFGPASIYCNIFPLRPRDFAIALQALDRRHMEQIQNLSHWRAKLVDTEQNRRIVGNFLKIWGPIRDERALAVDPQSILPLEWAGELFARWKVDMPQFEDTDVRKRKKFYGLHLCSTPSVDGAPVWDNVCHIRVFFNTQLKQVLDLMVKDHEKMEAVATSLREKYSVVRDLVCSFARRLGLTDYPIISFRQTVWYEWTPIVNPIIEALQALVKNADRIARYLRFVRPADKTSEDKAPAESRHGHVNVQMLLIPPSDDGKKAQKMHLDPSGILCIPATFTCADFDLNRFVHEIGRLVPHVLIAQPKLEPPPPTPPTTAKVVDSSKCFAQIQQGLELSQ